MKAINKKIVRGLNILGAKKTHVYASIGKKVSKYKGVDVSDFAHMLENSNSAISIKDRDESTFN